MLAGHRFWVLVGPHPNLVALRPRSFPPSVRSSPREAGYGPKAPPEPAAKRISVDFGGWRPPNPPEMVFGSAQPAHSVL